MKHVFPQPNHYDSRVSFQEDKNEKVLKVANDIIDIDDDDGDCSLPSNIKDNSIGGRLRFLTRADFQATNSQQINSPSFNFLDKGTVDLSADSDEDEISIK
jgi:hypothetical protein